ncbi:hypothetical protein PAXRUDRAFT_28670 [Paxillus rubicundulus Ve08.2h10]|uniref:Uncharacterized protein n=1 Tax=Paxillus rubicundulus Ve08.2h10 TaxID=930991 RepID=A0A0D0DC38_9AGAM|nr:hypothetical protein PAXRUDRAFT_28670 [Paxillus rubicundulus Ve08.2h10]
MQVISSDNEVPAQTLQPRHHTKLSSCLTDTNNNAIPELCIHQPIHARSITCGTHPTNTVTLDTSKRTAVTINSSESDHTDDDGKPKDIPRQSKRLCLHHAGSISADDELLQANSRATSVLEVPDEEYDSPANGQVGGQGSTSKSVPHCGHAQGMEHEADNDLELGTTSKSMHDHGRVQGTSKAENDLESAKTVPRLICPENGVDEDGFFHDIHAQPINGPKKRGEDKTRNVNAFFTPPRFVKSSNGKQ